MARTVEDVRVMELLLFLEWLDENEVEPDGWKYPNRTHEETAKLYLARD